MHRVDAAIERRTAVDDPQEDHVGLLGAGEGNINVSEEHRVDKVEPVDAEGRAAEAAEVRDDHPQRQQHRADLLAEEAVLRVHQPLPPHQAEREELPHPRPEGQVLQEQTQQLLQAAEGEVRQSYIHPLPLLPRFLHHHHRGESQVHRCRLCSRGLPLPYAPRAPQS